METQANPRRRQWHPRPLSLQSPTQKKTRLLALPGQRPRALPNKLLRQLRRSLPHRSSRVQQCLRRHSAARASAHPPKLPLQKSGGNTREIRTKNASTAECSNRVQQVVNSTRRQLALRRERRQRELGLLPPLTRTVFAGLPPHATRDDRAVAAQYPDGREVQRVRLEPSVKLPSRNPRLQQQRDEPTEEESNFLSATHAFPVTAEAPVEASVCFEAGALAQGKVKVVAGVQVPTGTKVQVRVEQVLVLVQVKVRGAQVQVRGKV